MHNFIKRSVDVNNEKTRVRRMLFVFGFCQFPTIRMLLV